MLARSSFDYAVVRVVPRVERGEFLNVGIILFCRVRRFLGARIALDEHRLQVLYPDVDVVALRNNLDVIPLICTGGKGAGPVGQLPQAERFHWLVAPRSTVVQTSPVHSGLCMDPAITLEQLVDALVRAPQ